MELQTVRNAEHVNLDFPQYNQYDSQQNSKRTSKNMGARSLLLFKQAAASR
jgi:hypothetical protein